MLRFEGVAIETRVVNPEIVDGSRSKRANPAGRELVKICITSVPEAWYGRTAKRQGVGLGAMFVYSDEVELVYLRWVEVKAADVLVDTVGLCGAECIDIGARIWRGNIRLRQVDRDWIERAGRHHTSEPRK